MCLFDPTSRFKPSAGATSLVECNGKKKKNTNRASFYLPCEEEFADPLPSFMNLMSCREKHSSPSGDLGSATRPKKESIGLICCRAVTACDRSNSLKTQIGKIASGALSPIPEAASNPPSRQVSRGPEEMKLSNKVCEEEWRLDFPGPELDDERFQQTLHSSMIALEEIGISRTGADQKGLQPHQQQAQQQQQQLVGRMRVLNLSYGKKVFVRTSCDGWRSYENYDASYHSSPQQYTDSFEFKVPLPPPHQLAGRDRIEFACCYCTDDGEEYWDANGEVAGKSGKVNYALRTTVQHRVN